VTALSRPCRLFAVDLDGTLLDHQGRPHAADVEALRQLQRRGVAVSFATGRLYGGAFRAAHEIGLRGPLACADGSHIADAETGDDLLHHAFPAPTLGRLQRAFKRHRVASFLLDRDRVIHDEQGVPFLGYVRIWSERLHHHPEEITEHPSWSSGATVLLGVGTREPIQALHDEVKATAGDAVQAWAYPVSRSFAPLGDHPTWSLLLRASGPSKGTAIEWLARHHGCTPAEAIVVGDWHNDVSMFKVAGRSFAMAQAPDEVKSAASEVLAASSATGGGIAEAARRAGLLP
jgi:hydroxymethylpyrimidine pyrophosphatase-like HAD family hydrolase